jgi:hypothetical protein
MNDHSNNVLAGAGIALASLGGLFAQAPPGTLGVAGSVIVLATLIVRAVQELGRQWIALQTDKLRHDDLSARITQLELEAENLRKLASIGYCPLDPNGNGQPACLRPASSTEVQPVPKA